MSQLGHVLLFDSKSLEEKPTCPAVWDLLRAVQQHAEALHTTWTHAKEGAQLHNSLLFLLQRSQQVQEFILHQEALRQEEGKLLVEGACHFIS